MKHEPLVPGRPERVVLFHDFSEPLGGASHLVQVLIAQLRGRGVAVTFFAGDGGANFRRDDVEFVPLHGKALLDRSRAGALALGLYNPAAFARTRDWIARRDTPGTIYHLHGWSKILSPAIFAALRPVADRLVLHGHDYFNSCPNGGFFDFAKGRDCQLVPLSGACLRARCDKASYPHKLWRTGREALRRRLHGGIGEANRLLMIHPAQRERFVAAGWLTGKLAAVRNPVTPPCAERVHAERNRGVLFIGRISAEKGADLAARAAARANVPLTFVGDGAEQARVSVLYPGAAFLGRQDRAGVARALRQARVAVMPSRWSEPFGLVALEAAGSGVPVIVSERALVADEIAGAGIGVAIDTADIPAFAVELERLHGDDVRVGAMSRAGHARWRALCNSEDSWVEDILGHYRSVLHAARRAGAAIPGARP